MYHVNELVVLILHILIAAVKGLVEQDHASFLVKNVVGGTGILEGNVVAFAAEKEWREVALGSKIAVR